MIVEAVWYHPSYLIKLLQVKGFRSFALYLGSLKTGEEFFSILQLFGLIYLNWILLWASATSTKSRRTGVQLKSLELKNCSRSTYPSVSYRILNNVVSALTKRRRKSSLPQRSIDTFNQYARMRRTNDRTQAVTHNDPGDPFYAPILCLS
jgi:hypothetical protein